MSSASPTSPPLPTPSRPTLAKSLFVCFNTIVVGAMLFFYHFVRLFVPVHPHSWLAKSLSCLMALPLVPLVLFRYLILLCQLGVLFFICRRIS